MTEFYGNDLSIDKLRLHLDIMSQNLPKSNGRSTLHCVIKGGHTHPKSACFTSLHISIADLVLLATNATSERSFSTLQRINILRSTVTIVRLNNV